MSELLHLKSDLEWKGTGVNASMIEGLDMSNLIQRLQPQWMRVPLSLPDPGADAMCLSDSSMDLLWRPIAVKYACSGILTSAKTPSKEADPGSKLILVGGIPMSWLTSRRELRGDALVAYARFIVAGVLEFRKARINVGWLELLEGVDNSVGGSIAPDNYPILVRTFKSHLQHRNGAPVKVLGPCVSRLVSAGEYTDPYSSAFMKPENQALLDGWSIHAIESEADKVAYNAPGYEGRMYVYRQAVRSFRFLKWTRKDLPIFVTKLGTNATRYSTGVDYGKGAPETVEHALRIIESVCCTALSGASVIVSWAVLDKRDNKSLHRADSYRRPHCEALAYVSETLPPGGVIYRPNEASNQPAGDETINMLVVKGNSFGFILCRSHKSDALEGKYTLKLSNPAWKTAADTVSYVATITLSAFPTYVSLTGTDRAVTVDSNGILSIEFQELPYNCVIFGQGDVYATNLSTSQPPESCPSCPSRTCLEVDRVSDTSQVQSPTEGVLVWSILDRGLMTYVSGKWINVVASQDTGCPYR